MLPLDAGYTRQAERKFRLSLEGAMDKCVALSELERFRLMSPDRRVELFCELSRDLTPDEWAEVEERTRGE